MNQPVMAVPVVVELDPVPDVVLSLEAVSDLPDVVLLESRIDREEVSRFSFLVADPVEFVTCESADQGVDPFGRLRELLEESETGRIAGLPPFQGGVVGMLGYELSEAWETTPRSVHDEFSLPALAAGLYDRVIAWDHVLDRAWVISQGFPESDPQRRWQRATQRADEIIERLSSRSQAATDQAVSMSKKLDRQQLAPLWPVEGHEGLYSDFSRDSYLEAVGRVIEYIHAGDIFQANLSQRLLTQQPAPALELYARLRQRNPAPFSGYMSHEDWQIVSASPERFVSLRDGLVETRPIKGTRRRPGDPGLGVLVQGELSESGKDRAENVMIVDLLRNDLSRVCRPSSVTVPLLCGVEVYETVLHLVSQIRGVLREGLSAWDLLAAVFPGGSITGAPKVRAMEVIAEIEPTVRGPYCGSLFYVGCDGSMDSSILIRTFVVRHGWVQCSVGGGIVAESDPVSEYNETMDKAAGMLRALA
ncbi:MAG: anthranilate synthase component I family protein [Planctomycetota bacterium]|nr:anthranilate synthase component I family protein [Planctomycetota bacterium]